MLLLNITAKMMVERPGKIEIRTDIPLLRIQDEVKSRYLSDWSTPSGQLNVYILNQEQYSAFKKSSTPIDVTILEQLDDEATDVPSHVLVTYPGAGLNINSASAKQLRILPMLDLSCSFAASSAPLMSTNATASGLLSVHTRALAHGQTYTRIYTRTRTHMSPFRIGHSFSESFQLLMTLHRSRCGCGRKHAYRRKTVARQASERLVQLLSLPLTS